MDHSPSLGITRQAPPRDRWLDKFERQAVLNPSRIAVISGDNSMSYGELSVRSNKLANLLRARGVGRGNFVGLGLDRSPELPIALLGIMKSGAAYVPLDPGYPAARIEQMVNSAGLRLVVTRSELSSVFSDVETLCMEDGDLDAIPATVPLDGPKSDDLIYAIFTSGSTGQPKAATVRHDGFENLLRWYSIELDLGPADRTLIISSPSFDLTQKNFFAPLVTGGTLILDDSAPYDVARISSLIRKLGVTLINCTPSAFYPLVDAAAADDYVALASLRFAVLGGEPISVNRLRRWLEHPTCHAEVVNSYGPTECTDICAFHRLHRGNLDVHPFVPLGREIPGAVVRIVDEALNPLPDGETGELHISGTGVGGGYLNDSARTAAVFAGGGYRSGDLARRLPSGLIEFRGRADHQVKVNGFRIELGEIESTLESHPNVRECIVTAAGDRLIAFITGETDAATLRSFLAARLPSYMVPGEFEFRNTFPLTPNGKVDRLALAATVRSGSSSIQKGSSLESRVLALWSEVLDRPLEDPIANFFDLGGNSIHLAVIHVRLMEMTSRQFPITTLFGLPSARAIAGFLSPAPSVSLAPAAQARARQAHAGFSRFRRPISP
ncbi:MAG: non-ribosomal peptide synthetase [Verrucomicrobiota bacterium]